MSKTPTEVFHALDFLTGDEKTWSVSLSYKGEGRGTDEAFYLRVIHDETAPFKYFANLITTEYMNAVMNDEYLSNNGYKFRTNEIEDIVALWYGCTNTCMLNATGSRTEGERTYPPFESRGIAVSNPFLDPEYFDFKSSKKGFLQNPSRTYKAYDEWKEGLIDGLLEDKNTFKI